MYKYRTYITRYLVTPALFLILAGCSDDGPLMNTEYIEAHPGSCPVTDRVYPGDAQVCDETSFPFFSDRQLTDFGGRPRWSSDGKRIVFVEGEYEEAYEVTVDTGEVTCITCEFEHEGIYRAYYMNNDDYLLLSTEEFRNRTYNRFMSNAIYWMPADRSRPPKYLGEEHFEGVAVSRESRKIAYFTSFLDTFSPSKLFLAEVSLEGELVNKEEVRLPEFSWLDRWLPFEAQDLFIGDAGLIFSHYGSPVQTYSYNFETEELVNQSSSSAHEEPEGMFPDNRFAAMESNRHVFGSEGPERDQYINSEVYLLRLDGTGETSYRLTYLTREPEQWANNPNVSASGCEIAYSIGRGPVTRDRTTGTFGGIRTIEFHQCRNPTSD